MKQFKFLLLLLPLFFFSCETVSPGHKGVEVSFGGETNINKIYSEGMHWGLHWIGDDLVEYDVREQTITYDFEFNDANNMITGVEVAVDFSYDPMKVNILHTKITDIEAKLEKTIKSAGKEVIPSYGAVDLNLTKRGEAEERLAKMLTKELPEFYLVLYRVQITDVDIPTTISDQAKKTAEQIERNKLAAQMAEEKTNLGNAQVAEAMANAEAAKYEAEAARFLSTPQLLKLKELEVQLKWAEKGVSPYGNNNVFGSGVSLVRMVE